MGHLSEDAAVGRGDALDGGIGTVHVPLSVHAHISFRIAVLGGYLSVFKQLLQPLVACHEAAFAVGCGSAVYSSRLCSCQPGRFVRYHLRVNHA